MGAAPPALVTAGLRPRATLKAGPPGQPARPLRAAPVDLSAPLVLGGAQRPHNNHGHGDGSCPCHRRQADQDGRRPDRGDCSRCSKVSGCQPSHPLDRTAQEGSVTPLCSAPRAIGVLPTVQAAPTYRMCTASPVLRHSRTQVAHAASPRPRSVFCMPSSYRSTTDTIRA